MTAQQSICVEEARDLAREVRNQEYLAMAKEMEEEKVKKAKQAVRPFSLFIPPDEFRRQHSMKRPQPEWRTSVTTCSNDARR